MINFFILSHTTHTSTHSQGKVKSTTRHATYLIYEEGFTSFLFLSSNNKRRSGGEGGIRDDDRVRENIWLRFKNRTKATDFFLFHDLRLLLPNQQKDFSFRTEKKRKVEWK